MAATTTNKGDAMRTSSEIMAEMRTVAGPNTWVRFTELQREYNEVKAIETVHMQEHCDRLAGGHRWFGKRVSA